MTCTFQLCISHSQRHCKKKVSSYRSLKKKSFLPDFFSSDPNERAHFWLPDSEAPVSQQLLDSPVSERMYIDQGEVLRVRVEAEDFYDDEPGPPKMAEGVQIMREPKRAPYNIIVGSSVPICNFAS